MGVNRKEWSRAPGAKCKWEAADGREDLEVRGRLDVQQHARVGVGVSEGLEQRDDRVHRASGGINMATGVGGAPAVRVQIGMTGCTVHLP